MRLAPNLLDPPALTIDLLAEPRSCWRQQEAEIVDQLRPGFPDGQLDALVEPFGLRLLTRGTALVDVARRCPTAMCSEVSRSGAMSPWEHQMMANALKDLEDALATSGFAWAAGPTSEDVEAVARLEELLGPWGLALDLTFLWRTIDPTTLPAQVRDCPAYRPCDALARWEAQLESPHDEPANLVPIAGAAEREVALDARSGGTLWTWTTESDEVLFFAPKAAQWLSLLAEAIKEGQFLREPAGTADVAIVEHDVYRSLLLARLGNRRGVLPAHSRAPGRWPPLWVAQAPDLDEWRARQGRPLVVPGPPPARDARGLPRVRDALDRLFRAVAVGGFRAPRPPHDGDDLRVQAIEHMIEPWPVPEDLAAFWSRVDPPTIPVQAYVEWNTPAHAANSTPAAPPILLQIAHGPHHECVGIDVHPDGDGALWRWNIVDGDFELFARSLGECLDLQSEVLEAGQWIKSPYAWRGERFDIAALGPGDYREALAHRLGVAPNELPRVPREPDRWPTHWSS